MLREIPNPGVIEWIQNHPEDKLFLSALVIGELTRGVALLHQGKKRNALDTWIQSVEVRFDGRILRLGEKECAKWGSLSAELQRQGIQVPMADGLIAATALVHKMTLVTRNVKDMQPMGVRVENPWK